jgi:hypothetical protein
MSIRRFVLATCTVGAMAIGPVAAAQVVVPPGGDVDVNAGTGRTERTARTPGTGRTEGTGRTPGTPGTPGTERTPGTGRTQGTGRTGDPSSLPTTGFGVTEAAIDGLTLLGAGLVLSRIRRRTA